MPPSCPQVSPRVKDEIVDRCGGCGVDSPKASTYSSAISCCSSALDSVSESTARTGAVEVSVVNAREGAGRLPELVTQLAFELIVVGVHTIDPIESKFRL